MPVGLRSELSRTALALNRNAAKREKKRCPLGCPPDMPGAVLRVRGTAIQWIPTPCPPCGSLIWQATIHILTCWTLYEESARDSQKIPSLPVTNR